MTPDVAPSLEDQLHDALHEVAESVTHEQLLAVWPDAASVPLRARRTRILATVAIAVALAVAVAVTVEATTSATRPRSPGPATVSCPGRAPLRVPQQHIAGTDSTFVPGNPIELLACRYHGLNQPEPVGTFAGSARLAPGSLVAALNAQPLIPKDAVGSCPADFGETIMLIFEYADGSRFTVSIDTSGCLFANNSNRAVHTPLATLSQLQDVVGQDRL